MLGNPLSLMLYLHSAHTRVFKRGSSPSFQYNSPFPLRERGIKGVRVTTNINIARLYPAPV